MKNKFLKSAEVQEILEAYPNTKASVLAEKHGVPVSKIYATAKRYGVQKSPEFMAGPNSGRIAKGQSLSPETRFQKGMISPRKGKKMEFKSAEAEQKSAASRWKKGQKPVNAAQDGEVRWREAFGYHYIRISENNWELYHRWLWIQKNGFIPEGHNIVFKDSNPKNCVLDNLECISNKELMARNTIARYPGELIGSMHRVSRLKKIIKNKENG